MSLLPNNQVLKRRGIFILALWATLIFPSFAQVEELEVLPPPPLLEDMRRAFPAAIIDFCPFTMSFTITATPQEQREIERIIREFDAPTPQVTIEAKFIELTVTDIGELGIELDMPELKDFKFRTRWGLPPVPAALIEGGGLWFERLSPLALRAVLRAMEREGRASLLSAPRITTLDGQEAFIEFLEAIPYVAAVTLVIVEGEEFIDLELSEEESGIFLGVIPRVINPPLINLEILATVAQLIGRAPDLPLAPPGLGHPIIDDRIIETVIVIESGETIVLGGLVRREEMVTERKIPLLGDIPLLGHLFRHKHTSIENKNLLIFITASLVDPWGQIAARRPQ